MSDSLDNGTPTDSAGDANIKTALRQKVRAARKAFVAGLDPMAHRLAFHAIPSPVRAFLSECHIVALYSQTGDEAPALRLAAALIAEGKQICLPYVVDKMGTMRFHAWAPGDEMEDGAFGTMQPSRHAPVLHPDAIFAPLVAFDAQLNRLGQGGGYYDRAFARYDTALRIGVAWSVQQVESVPADPWDAPLHRVMTETAIFEPATAESAA